MTIGRIGGSPTAASSAVVLVGTLISIYIVSQFLRNSIGVIAPNLAVELSLSPGEIGLLSSVFFFAFAAVQIPLGMALDRFGPRRCLLAGAATTVVGAVVFATAPTPEMLILGRALLGLGSSSAFVSSLAVYAKRFQPDFFATLTAVHYGIGTLGTLLATAPLAFSTAVIGWRASFLIVGAVALVAGVLIAVVVKDHDHGSAAARRETLRESLAGIVAVTRIPSMGRLFLMNIVIYSSFTLVAGLWGGPYLTHIYGFGLEERGTLLLIPVTAQIVGSFVWGPMDRVLGSYRRPVLAGAIGVACLLAYLAVVGKLSATGVIIWFAAFGFVSAFGPLLVAHGQSLFPVQLVGRGLTLLNMASMGGVFFVQFSSGYLIGLFPVAADGSYPVDAYRLVFGLQAVIILLACLGYFGCADPAIERAKASSASSA